LLKQASFVASKLTPNDFSPFESKLSSIVSVALVVIWAYVLLSYPRLLSFAISSSCPDFPLLAKLAVDTFSCKSYYIDNIIKSIFVFIIKYDNIKHIIKNQLIMKNIDKEIISLIEKYPFLTDPITLFKTDSNLEKIDYKSWFLDINYPEINKYKKQTKTINLKLNNILDKIKKTNFKDKFIKKEYIKRIKDFKKITKLIKIFNKKNEKQKQILLNSYFHINLKKIWKILKNKNKLINYFQTKEIILKNKEKSYLNKTIINSKQIKKYFEEALKYLNLDKNWEVKIGDTTSIVHTNFNKNWWKIIIPQSRKISLKKLIELIIHEIDWHCVQFSNANWLFSWSIRFSNSEALLEWYAIFLEYSLSSKYFWENKIKQLINKKQLHYKFITWKISLNKLIDNYKWNLYRLFRWFKNIKKYWNYKDLVYLEWISNIIKKIEKYWNFLNLIKIGTINKKYIKKHWTQTIKNNFKLETTSAIHILNKILKENEKHINN